MSLQIEMLRYCENVDYLFSISFVGTSMQQTAIMQ